MTLEEIRAQHKRESKIRQTTWHPDLYLIVAGAGDIIYSSNDTKWLFSLDDMFADDWELYEEPVKGLSLVEFFSKWESGQKIRNVEWDKGVYVIISGACLNRPDGSFYGMQEGESLDGLWEIYEEEKGHPEKCEACKWRDLVVAEIKNAKIGSKIVIEKVCSFLLKRACECKKVEKKTCGTCQVTERMHASGAFMEGTKLESLIFSLLKEYCTCEDKGE
jgi:hypothetical protein